MTRLGQNHIFALYSLPYRAEHYLIRQQGSTVQGFKPSDLQREGFVVYPFQASADSPAVFITKDSFYKNPSISFFSQHEGEVKSINRQTYLRQVEEFIGATQRDFQKIIFSRIETIHLQTGDLFQLFMTLKELYPNAFVYLFNLPNIGCWMGASPEVFVNQQGGELQTVALAGTQRDLGISLESVTWGEKEIEEQAIVERYIENILQQQKVNYQKTAPYTARAGKLLHLKTKFRFQPNKNFSQFLKQLHPTPAVCGIPKKAAMQFILNHEKHDRAYYSGYLGPVNIRQETNLFVNLRCMQVFKDKFALYVGGGITADSDPVREWDETEIKSQTMADVIESLYLQESHQQSFI